MSLRIDSLLGCMAELGADLRENSGRHKNFKQWIDGVDIFMKSQGPIYRDWDIILQIWPYVSSTWADNFSLNLGLRLFKTCVSYRCDPYTSGHTLFETKKRA